MAQEQEELKLTVALDDQASEGLTRLQAQLQKITDLTAPAAQGLANLSQQIGGAGGHAQAANTSLAAMAARGGFFAGMFFEIGRGVERMGREFVDAIFNISRYADEMVRLQQQSSRAATSMAQFARNVALFRESGVSAEAAAKNLQGFSDALADLQQVGSRIQTNLLGGLRGAEFEDMRNFINRVMTLDPETAKREIKKFGEDIRAYQTSLGKPEFGAYMQRQFYAQFGMPDLDKLRGDFEQITPELERMYARRTQNAERLQSATGKLSDDIERVVRSTQASALYLLPVTEAIEKVAEYADDIANYLESWEEAIGNADKALTSATQEHTFFGWLFDKIGLFPHDRRTRGQEADEGGELFPQGVPLPRARPPTQTWRIPSPQMQQFLGTGDTDTGESGPGKELDVSKLGITPIGEALGHGAPIAVPEDDFAGTGWRGLPMSRHVIDLRGESAEGDEYEGNTIQIALLAQEVRRVNSFLAPEMIKLLQMIQAQGGTQPAFHNAPMGGAVGESNPMQLPQDAAQPGGGAAAEARNIYLRGLTPERYSEIAPELPASASGRALEALGTTHQWEEAVNIARQPSRLLEKLSVRALQRLAPSSEHPPVTPVAGQHEVKQYAKSELEKLQESAKEDDPNRRAIGGPIGDVYDWLVQQATKPVVKPGGAEALQKALTPTTPGPSLTERISQAASNISILGRPLYDPTNQVAQRPEAPTEPQVAQRAENARASSDLFAQHMDAKRAADEYQNSPERAMREAKEDSLPTLWWTAGTPTHPENLMSGPDPSVPVQMRPQLRGYGFKRYGQWEKGGSMGWQARAAASKQLEAEQAFNTAELPGPPTLSQQLGLGDVGSKRDQGFKFESEVEPDAREIMGGGDPELARIMKDFREAHPEIYGRDKADGSALDGSVLDKDASSKIDLDTSGSLSVDVKAPAGTKVKAEGDGLFSKTKLNRSMPPPTAPTRSAGQQLEF